MVCKRPFSGRAIVFTVETGARRKRIIVSLRAFSSQNRVPCTCKPLTTSSPCFSLCWSCGENGIERHVEIQSKLARVGVINIVIYHLDNVSSRVRETSLVFTSDAGKNVSISVIIRGLHPWKRATQPQAQVKEKYPWPCELRLCLRLFSLWNKSYCEFRLDLRRSWQPGFNIRIYHGSSIRRALMNVTDVKFVCSELRSTRFGTPTPHCEPATHYLSETLCRCVICNCSRSHGFSQAWQNVKTTKTNQNLW